MFPKRMMHIIYNVIIQNQIELYCQVYTYEEFVFMTEDTAVQQNESDRTKTQIIFNTSSSE